MPELPEVETSCRGIAPHIIGCSVTAVTVRQAQLRWRVPCDLAEQLHGAQIISVTRRGKYILIHTDKGVLLIHLGMSGNVRIVNAALAAGKHDHVDIGFNNQTVLRFNDTRRFGAILWTNAPPEMHHLLLHLGVEPLSADFTGAYLYQKISQRRVAIKVFIMNSHIVVGVGNIYANEALFMANILPSKAAGALTLLDCERLVSSIKRILHSAIERGGTTLRDFVNESGQAGYFQQQLHVYGRGGQHCTQCQQALVQSKLAGRTTVFCQTCQK